MNTPIGTVTSERSCSWTVTIGFPFASLPTSSPSSRKEEGSPEQVKKEAACDLAVFSGAAILVERIKFLVRRSEVLVT